ncbi:hypothetical protein D9756_003192 [Leucocoprinus leucothites]|uniref:Ty3 transposon capsid-like protein domain-containing protein n=1 Tax=Leucocoprinus leucothites TaxID=201217 RepID=A0A8H5LJX5_9AGAR|nr:hypothetical protein D9756_008980 [Leucoagaricus leucothites]KAF5359859.1 hypothetical protein D9756_003192 [Leucoagaricus leucothites]
MANTRTAVRRQPAATTSTTQEPKRSNSVPATPAESSTRSSGNNRIPSRIRRSRRLNPNLPSTPQPSQIPRPTRPLPRRRDTRPPSTPAPPGGMPPDRDPSGPSEPGDEDGLDYVDPPHQDDENDDWEDIEDHLGSPENPDDPDDNDPDDDDSSSSSSDDLPAPPPRPRRRDRFQDRLADALSRLADNLDHRPQPNAAPVNKARLPDTFSGTDPDKLNTFLIQCRLYFRANPTQFQEDSQKVNFAMTYLTGVALDWFEVALTQEEQGVFHDWITDWDAFTRELRTHFGVANPKSEAAELLDNLRMKSGDKIATYNIDFMKYAAQLGWGDEVLCHRYYKGLPNRIQDPISVREQGKPNTFQEMLRTAMLIDGRYWERDRERARARAAEKDLAERKQSKPSNSSNNPQPNSQRGSSSQPSNFDRGNNNSNNNNSGSNNNRNTSQAPSKSTTPAPSTSNQQRPSTRPTKPDISDKLGKDGKLTPEERKRRIDEDLCLFCGGKGHKVDQCHRKQNRAKIRKADAAPAKDSEKSSEK